VPTTKSTLFTMCKDKWDIKEGTGKSIPQYCNCTQLPSTNTVPPLVVDHLFVDLSIVDYKLHTVFVS